MRRTILVLAALTMLTGCWQVSEGERAGVVTKFSHKGAIWQSWEGELHYAGANGTIVADSWEFALDNAAQRGENLQALVEKLTEAQRSGRRVKIVYKQEMATAPWRSGSPYLVQSVEFVD